MKLQQLRYFVEIARSRSFTRAASNLAIAQPALSQNIAALEGEIGAKLFERHAKGVDLSTAGQRLLARSQDLLAAFDGLKEHVTAQPERVSGQVRLCIAGSLAAVVIAPLLRALAAQHPQIDLRVSDGLSSEIRAQVESGRAHLALMPSGAELQGMASLPLFEERFLLFGACEEMAHAPAQVTFVSLADRALALPDRAHDLRKIVERSASQAGIRLDVRYELNSPAMLVAVAQQGLAFAILPNSACVEAVAAGLIAARPIVAPELSRVQALVWPEASPPAPAAAAVRDALVGVVEALVARGALQGRFMGPGLLGHKRAR